MCSSLRERLSSHSDRLRESKGDLHIQTLHVRTSEAARGWTGAAAEMLGWNVRMPGVTI